MGRKTKRDRAVIDHAKIIDSFGELQGRTHYESFESTCGRCGAPFTFTAAAQKHVHEVTRAPVKAASRAGLCRRCSLASAETKRARRDRAAVVRAAELARARAVEQPKHGGLLLEYVVAKLRVLEQDWSTRSAERLLGEVRRVARLDPTLSKAAGKREAQLQAMLTARRA